MNDMNKSDYESLKDLGYTEEEIKVALDSISKISVFSSPLNESRDDKGIKVSPNGGEEKRTSNIMMGYNKDGITLDNGDYLELDEVIKAIEESLKEDKENTSIICKKTGKKVGPAEALEGILGEAIKGSTLGIEDSFVFDNQNSVSVQINDVSGKTYDKGHLMLGQIQMPNGEYVSVEEINAAINNYVFMTPGEEVIVTPPKEIPQKETPTKETPVVEPTKEEETKEKKEEKEEKHKIIKRIRKKIVLIPLIIGVSAYILSGLSMQEIEAKSVTELNNLDYQVQEMVSTTSHIYESDEEVLQRIQSDIKVGEEASVLDGQKYYASSDYEYGGNNLSGTFGSVTRPEGEYTVDRVSVLHDGHIINVDAEEGKDINQILEETAKEYGVEVSELEAKASLVGPVSGWVPIDALNQNADKTPQIKETVVEVSASDLISGSIENFEGDTIVVDGSTIKIKDENGNLLKDGTVVKSEDGKEFRISSLGIEEKTLEETEVVGKKLHWSLQDCEKELLLIGALSAFMRRKKKEYVDMTDSELDKLIEAKKEEYEHDSEFTKAIETITSKKVELGKTAEDLAKSSLIDQSITLEEFDGPKGMGL